MAASLFYPWWSFQLSYGERTDVFPYLLQGPGSELVGYKRSPQMELLTGLIIAAILLCVAGSILKFRLGRAMLILSGGLVLLAAWRFLARMMGVASRFGLPVQGLEWGSLGGFARVEVHTWFRPGMYLIVAAGVLALLAGLLFYWVRFDP